MKVASRLYFMNLVQTANQDMNFPKLLKKIIKSNTKSWCHLKTNSIHSSPYWCHSTTPINKLEVKCLNLDFKRSMKWKLKQEINTKTFLYSKIRAIFSVKTSKKYSKRGLYLVWWTVSDSFTKRLPFV